VIRRWAGCAEVDDHLMSARSTPTRRAKIYLDSTLVNLSPNPMYARRHDFGEIQERTHDRGFKASCVLDGKPRSGDTCDQYQRQPTAQPPESRNAVDCSWAYSRRRSYCILATNIRLCPYFRNQECSRALTGLFQFFGRPTLADQHHRPIRGKRYCGKRREHRNGSSRRGARASKDHLVRAGCRWRKARCRSHRQKYEDPPEN
jgi:hypothetical protein